MTSFKRTKAEEAHQKYLGAEARLLSEIDDYVKVHARFYESFKTVDDACQFLIESSEEIIMTRIQRILAQIEDDIRAQQM